MSRRLAAWTVLDDCRNAHRLLSADDPDSNQWRVHWVACLTLLRAVGHVLGKIDRANASATGKSFIDSAWKEWNDGHQSEHSIFRDFIEEARNRVIKEGAIDTTPEPDYLLTEDGDRLLAEDGDPLIGEQPFFRMTLAGFEGKDGLDLIAAAIGWWERRLTEIEAAI